MSTRRCKLHFQLQDFYPCEKGNCSTTWPHLAILQTPHLMQSTASMNYLLISVDYSTACSSVTSFQTSEDGNSPPTKSFWLPEANFLLPCFKHPMRNNQLTKSKLKISSRKCYRSCSASFTRDELIQRQWRRWQLACSSPRINICWTNWKWNVKIICFITCHPKIVPFFFCTGICEIPKISLKNIPSAISKIQLLPFLKNRRKPHTT